MSHSNSLHQPPSEKLTTSSQEPRPKKNKSKSATTWTSWARGRRFAFSSGIAIGLAFSAYQFAPQTLPPDLMSLLSGSKANAGFMSSWFQDTTNPFPSMNLEGWGFDWDWRDLANNLSVVEQTRKAFNSKEFSPAEELIAKEPGIGAHYPVILIPGVSSNASSAQGQTLIDSRRASAPKIVSTGTFALERNAVIVKA